MPFFEFNDFSKFLGVVYSLGVTLPKKHVFFLKKIIWSCPLYGHFVDLTILTCHSRVVYSFGVVTLKKLVSFLTKNKFGVVFSLDTLLKK